LGLNQRINVMLVLASNSVNSGTPTAANVKYWLAGLARGDCSIEIRAPKFNDGHTTRNIVSRFGPRKFEDAATEALRLSGHAPAVYIVLNGVSTALPLGCSLRGPGAKAGDILRRRWLLVDCDPKRPGTVNATDTEKAAAFLLAMAVWDALVALGWPEPIVADSGNGYHLIFRIDLAADDTFGTGPDGKPTREDGPSTLLVKRVLAALARRFDTATAKVDRGVYDLPRLVKLYGTRVCKGEDTPERPARYARVLSIPAEITPVSVELLEAIAAQAPLELTTELNLAADIERDHGNDHDHDHGDEDGFGVLTADVESRAIAYLENCEPAISGHGGHDQTFKVTCAIGPGFDLHPDTAFRLLREHYNPRCDPPWSEKELQHKVTEAYKVEERRGWLRDAHRNNTPRIGAGPEPSSNGQGGDGGGRGKAAQARKRAAALAPLEADNDPFRLARVVLTPHIDAEKNRRLVHYRDEFHFYDGTCFRPDPFFPRSELPKKIKAELDHRNLLALARFKKTSGKSEKPRKPPQAVRVTRALTGDVSHALAAITSVDRDVEPPYWLDRQPDDPDPLELLPARNGLIDLSQNPPVILRHTPALFNRFVLPFHYDPGAREPKRWLKLLHDQWAADPDSINTIHEIVGCLLCPDIRFQRIFLLIGPARSGRGTMREVITGLIGSRNIASTSAIALCGQFGLEPLLGKTVAIMGDARTGDGHDTAVLLDRLLRISGCDPVEVNRKGKPILADVTLPVRFVIISNEVPNFRDASGAIVSRYLVIKATRTIPEQDRIPDLARTILEHEAAGILNLAIAGRQRLHERGRFIQPESAADLLDDAANLASPVSRFIREHYDLDTDSSEPTFDVFNSWKVWAEAHGYTIGNDGVFGKNLKAAFPSIKKTRPREGEKQVCRYQGIRRRWS
jgi:putative DNA primase/helicase